MSKYLCKKYDKEFVNPHRKRKCLLTRGNPKGCIWKIELMKELVGKNGENIQIHKEEYCRYLRIPEGA